MLGAHPGGAPGPDLAEPFFPPSADDRTEAFSPAGYPGAGYPAERTGPVPGWDTPARGPWPGLDQPADRTAALSRPATTAGSPLTAPTPRRRRRNRFLIVGVLVVVLVAAIAVLATRNSGGSPTATGSGKPAPPRIDSAATDPSALTLAEIFPHAQLTVDGVTFHEVAQNVDNNCSLAAHGAFASALTSAGCERVVRATFVDASRKYAITAGAAALPSLAAARSVDQRKSFGGDVWFSGLDGPASTGANHVSTNGGYGYDVLDGRYLIFALSTLTQRTAHGTSPAILNTLSHGFTSQIERPIAARDK